MKIENNSLNPLSPNGKVNGPSGNRATGQSRSSESRAVSKDKAEVSEAGRALAKAHAALEETSDVRTERVSQLREQVQNNEYDVPYEDLARILAVRLGIKR